MWNICGYELENGEKRQGYLKVSSRGGELPVTLICGKNLGKTLLITAGVHGDEYPGIAAAVRLAQILDPKKLRGNVIVCHCVNVSGLWELSRYVDGVPEQRGNLNDNFPGRTDGTTGEQIAAYFVKELFPSVDFILDLHSGSVMEPLASCLFFPGHELPVRSRRGADAAAVTGSAAGADPAKDGTGKPRKWSADGQEHDAGARGCTGEPECGTVRAQSLAAAQALDIPYLIESKAAGGLYSYAAYHCGIPGLLLENGHSGCCEEAWVAQNLQNIGRLLMHLDLYDPEPGSILAFPDKKAEQLVCTEAVYLEAGEQALWYPAIRENMEVRKGQLLGHTEDFFGNRRQEYYAQGDGRVFYYCSGLAVSEGRLLAAYGIGI